MRTLTLTLLALSLVACSSDAAPTDASPGRPDGATDGGGSDDAGSMPDSGPVEPVCTDILDGNDCSVCLEASCCAELAACSEDGACLDCLNGVGPCDATPVLMAFNSCVTTSCDVCIPRSECNPVTNAGCAAPGSCDGNTAGVFECFTDVADVAVCGACNNTSGPFCAAGLTCMGAGGTTCARFCCNDADCGTGTCDLSAPRDGVGVCVTDVAASCDAPVEAPSAGSCYTGATTGA